jgi:putative IMPACT (imprinted ancient) family translation regulator
MLYRWRWVLFSGVCGFITIRIAGVRLTLDYKQMQTLEYLLKKLDGHILQQDFAEQVRLIILLPAEQESILLQSFPDKRLFTDLKNTFV